MPSIVDKSSVFRVCVDGFALRKRFSYGTVVVDIESHRIVDMIPSRDTSDIALLLHSSPTTIKKHLGIAESEIPDSKDISRERQHQLALQQKQQEVGEARKLV